MISQKLQVVLILVLIIYFILIYYFLKKERLILKYSLIWLASGIMLGIMVIFPGVLMRTANLLGIYSDTNFLFLASIGFTVVIVMSLTGIVSSLSKSNKKLIQEIAILKNKVEVLETLIKDE